jgi:hypothetical protein
MSDAAWRRLTTLPPLRDEHGTIVLEEADDDTRTATFRIHARTALTATVTPAGEVRFDGDAPPVLVAACLAAKGDRPLPAANGAGPERGGLSRSPALVAAGVAAGIAALAARRRR